MSNKMGNEQDKARAFTEEVDRLISGQSARDDPKVDPVIREMLDFAQKMAASRIEPSPQFQANLKAKLLRRLAESEPVTEKRGWLSRLIPREPIWRATAAAAVVVIIIGIAWASGVLRNGTVPNIPTTPYVVVPTTPSATYTAPATTAYPTTTATVQASVTPAPTTTAATTVTPTVAPATTVPGMYVQADAHTDKSAYVSGENVDIEITLKNISPNNIKIEQYPPILSLMQTSTRQPVYTFTAGQNSLTLNPGGTASYTLIWKQTDFNGQPVSNGNYYVELEDIDSQGIAMKLTLLRPVSFDILPGSSTIH